MHVCLCIIYESIGSVNGPRKRANKVSANPSELGECQRDIFEATSLSAHGPGNKTMFLSKAKPIYTAFAIVSLHKADAGHRSGHSRDPGSNPFFLHLFCFIYWVLSPKLLLFLFLLLNNTAHYFQNYFWFVMHSLPLLMIKLKWLKVNRIAKNLVNPGSILGGLFFN